MFLLLLFFASGRYLLYRKDKDIHFIIGRYPAYGTGIQEVSG